MRALTCTGLRPERHRTSFRAKPKRARSGDLILFAAFDGDRQLNFEDQAGGHGSIGGEQLHPFVLARREWGVDTSRVTGAHQVHGILSDVRDRLRSDVEAAA